MENWGEGAQHAKYAKMLILIIFITQVAGFQHVTSCYILAIVNQSVGGSELSNVRFNEVHQCRNTFDLC